MAKRPDLHILPDVPNSEQMRRRLSIVLTEAAVLRQQIRVSTRLERERERLRRQDREAAHAR